MSITPVTPAENSQGKVKTWVNSQWKFSVLGSNRHHKMQAEQGLSYHM
jgi:hypothetical protein